MEVKINREIREYSEKIFFGMTFRQCLFAVLACCATLILFYFFKPIVGMEAVSWICPLGAAPFVAIGFITYHGMPAERFVLVYIKSEFLTPKKLTYHSTNFYYNAHKANIDEKKNKNTKKEEMIR